MSEQSLVNFSSVSQGQRREIPSDLHSTSNSVQQTSMKSQEVTEITFDVNLGRMSHSWNEVNSQPSCSVCTIISTDHVPSMFLQ